MIRIVLNQPVRGVGSPRCVTTGTNAVHDFTLLDLTTPRVPRGAAPRPGPSVRERGPSLRTRLIARDVVAIVAAASVVMFGAPEARTVALTTRLAVLGTVAIVTWIGILAQGLYRARNCSIRSLEVLRVGRAAIGGAVAGLLVAGYVHHPMAEWVVATALLVFATVAAQRGQFAAALRRARTAGRHCRPVVVIGGRSETERLLALLDQHPELGLRAVGTMGRRRDGEAGADIAAVPWLDDLETPAATVAAHGIDSVIVASGDLSTGDLNLVVRDLLDAGIHVQLSSGIWGVAHSRLRAVPLAHEPFLYLEPPTLSPVQRAAKRAFDVAVAGGLLVLSAPVLAVAAVAIRLQDRGPVVFRQVRVGLGGERFTLLKLRTMIPDADSQLVDLTSVNERSGGPLFKLGADPRRTRVGSVLERTSLDELPQLINVLRGDMSIVGPRPALPHEVASFDPEFQARHRVRPGITGLWQAEAREKPEFDVYRRLDLFYVENWSVGLDLAICMTTVAAVTRRLLPRPLRRTAQ